MKQMDVRWAVLGCMMALGCSQADPDAPVDDDSAGTEAMTSTAAGSMDTDTAGSTDTAGTTDDASAAAGAMTGGGGSAGTVTAGVAGSAEGETAGEMEPTTARGWPDATSYYPIVVGAEWVYRHEGGSTVWDEQVSVEMDGEDVLLVDSQSPDGGSSKDTLGLVGSSVMRVSKVELMAGQSVATVNYDPGFTRFDTAWLDRDDGHSEVLNYARQEWDATGALVKDGARSHTFIVEAKSATVEVPAGTFSDCVIVMRQRQRDNEADALDGDDKRYWFCPGVGKVKEEEPETGKTESLVSCTVPGGGCP